MSDQAQAHEQIYQRIHEVEKDSTAHDNKIDIQLAKLTEHQKEINRNVDRTEQQVTANATQIQTLRDIHTEAMQNNKDMYKQLEETTQLALVAKTDTEDLKTEVAPLITEHKEKLEDDKDKKRRWRDRGSEMLGYVGGAALLSILMWLFSILYDFIKS